MRVAASILVLDGGGNFDAGKDAPSNEVDLWRRLHEEDLSDDEEEDDGPRSVREPVLGYVVIRTGESNVVHEMEELASIPGVRYVERDHVMRFAGDRGLPRSRVVDATDRERAARSRRRSLAKARVVESDDSYAQYLWGIDMVNVTQLWDIEPASHIKICVADGGYDLGHIDLPVEGVTGWHPDIPDFGVWDVDLRGHGTHVAGTIGAIGGNGEGVVGINPDPSRFSFHIAKALSDNGFGTATTAMDAVSSCVDVGSKVVSMSLGCSNCVSEIQRLFYRDVYDQDVLIVAAAGNSGKDSLFYPASYQTAISVASVAEGAGEGSTSYGELSSFSARSDQVEISAPGSVVLSTVPGNGYGVKSGTSMACPHVSGIAALLWSHFPDCKNNQIRNAMIRSRSVREPSISDPRDTPGWDKYYGWGIVNAGLAYDLLLDEGCEGAGGTYSAPLSSTAAGGSHQPYLGCIKDEHCFTGNACLGEMTCDTESNTCYETSPAPECDDGVSCTADFCSSSRDGLGHVCLADPNQCSNSPRAPSCLEVGAPCDSGDLLEGSGVSERNTFSDTLDGCADGASGGTISFGSVQKITVSSADGGELQEGRAAKIEAVVSPFALGADFVHFYYADKVDAYAKPDWQWLGYFVNRNTTNRGIDLHVEMPFTLSVRGIQAVRVNFGILMPVGPCTTSVIPSSNPNSPNPDFSQYYDYDDLVFTVAGGTGDAVSDSQQNIEPFVPPVIDPIILCESLPYELCQVAASHSCRWNKEDSCVSNEASWLVLNGDHDSSEEEI
mmetsp:Transcript_2032/g.4441  ORF Transcript_2032/g.4441 Transcript_2032/m.4441 type:complete len:781 (-) Transcript_2032:143-2485(-)